MMCPFCGGELLPNSPNCIECGKELPAGTDKLIESEKQRKRSYSLRDHSDLLKISFFSMLYPGLAHLILFRDLASALGLAVAFTSLMAVARMYIGSYLIDMPALFLAYLVYSLSPLHAFNLYRERYSIRNDLESLHSILFFRFAAVVLTSIVFVYGYLFYQQNYYYLVNIANDEMSPVFRNGDTLMVGNEGAGGSYSRGDMVCFSPPYRTWVAGAVAYAGFEAVERIVGAPGETVVFGTSEIIVNGRSLDKKHYPLTRSSLGYLAGSAEVNLKNEEYLVFLNGRGADGVMRGAFVTITKNHVRGRVLAITYPFGRRKNF